VLNAGKDRLDAMGWNRRPDWLREDYAWRRGYVEP
jgi:hypothetical protein